MARSQQPIPDRDGKQYGDHADREKRGKPVLRLRVAADADHQSGDLVGAARLGAPEAVAIGLENKLALVVGAPGGRRSLGFAGSEDSHFRIA